MGCSRLLSNPHHLKLVQQLAIAAGVSPQSHNLVQPIIHKRCCICSRNTRFLFFGASDYPHWILQSNAVLQCIVSRVIQALILMLNPRNHVPALSTINQHIWVTRFVSIPSRRRGHYARGDSFPGAIADETYPFLYMSVQAYQVELHSVQKFVPHFHSWNWAWGICSLSTRFCSFNHGNEGSGSVNLDPERVVAVVEAENFAYLGFHEPYNPVIHNSNIQTHKIRRKVGMQKPNPFEAWDTEDLVKQNQDFQLVAESLADGEDDYQLECLNFHAQHQNHGYQTVEHEEQFQQELGALDKQGGHQVYESHWTCQAVPNLVMV
nr:hypothetical protein Iba_chr04bCG19410 [Ipomoea batatas]